MTTSRGVNRKMIVSKASRLISTFALVLSLWSTQVLACGAADAGSHPAATRSSGIKVGDECLQANDKRLCEQEEDLTRQVQLQIDSGAAMAATPVEFACNDNAKPFFMAYYHDLDPPAAVITCGDEQAIIFPQVAASGARYGRTGIEFWEHHGSARVNFHGIKLVCTPLP
jgi:uncharacterized protein